MLKPAIKTAQLWIDIAADADKHTARAIRLWRWLFAAAVVLGTLALIAEGFQQ